MVGAMLRRGGLYCVDIHRQDMAERVARGAMWRERRYARGEHRIEGP